MQRQSVVEGKAKDKWERKDCQVKQPINRSYTGNAIGSGNYTNRNERGVLYLFRLWEEAVCSAHSYCGH